MKSYWRGHRPHQGPLLMAGKEVLCWSWCQGEIQFPPCFTRTLSQSHRHVTPADQQVFLVIIIPIRVHVHVCARVGGRVCWGEGGVTEVTKILTGNCCLPPYFIGGVSEGRGQEASDKLSCSQALARGPPTSRPTPDIFTSCCVLLPAVPSSSTLLLTRAWVLRRADPIASVRGCVTGMLPPQRELLVLVTQVRP